MRFAITATDRYLGVFEALVERGWQPLKVFTSPVDQRLHSNTALIDYAQRLHLDVQLSPLSTCHLAELGQQGCEVLVVASYPWRIGRWEAHLPHAINFHPSPLPHGRGPHPLPAAILEQERSWGVTCHKIDAKFDHGDILKVNEFALAADECHESLDLKVQMAARRLSGEVAEQFATLWANASAQQNGSYVPPWSAQARRLDFSRAIEPILRQLRAFGPMECQALIGPTLFHVRRAVGWQESHRLPPGTLVHTSQGALVVAAADGFIALTQWSLIEPGAVTGTLPRS